MVNLSAPPDILIGQSCGLQAIKGGHEFSYRLSVDQLVMRTWWGCRTINEHRQSTTGCIQPAQHAGTLEAAIEIGKMTALKSDMHRNGGGSINHGASETMKEI